MQLPVGLEDEVLQLRHRHHPLVLHLSTLLPMRLLALAIVVGARDEQALLTCVPHIPNVR